jgi:hypothetical protein
MWNAHRPCSQPYALATLPETETAGSSVRPPVLQTYPIAYSLHISFPVCDREIKKQKTLYYNTPMTAAAVTGDEQKVCLEVLIVMICKG